jgi:hypothetical protein
MNGTRPSKRLETLKKRDAVTKAAVAAEKKKLKIAEAKDIDRECRLIGRAAVHNAAQSPEFEQFLRGTLRTTPMNDSDRKFLASRNWL